ncbi:MAG: DUF3160 domain-containing protein [Chloroflexota bacterium]
MKNSFRKLIWVFLVAVLVQGACIWPIATQTPEITPTATYGPPPEGVYPPSFAAYSLSQVRIPETFQGGGYTLPVDLTQVEGMDALELSAEQEALLSQNGFVVASPIAGQWQEFYQIYEAGRYYDMPPFITTDSIFHVYHLLFDKMLRDLERDYFIPYLRLLTSAMLAETSEQYATLRGTALEDQALRNVAFFGIADRLLELSDAIPAEAQSYVDAELALINAANGAGVSPLWDRPDLPEDEKLIEDYSQYIPRGHYTRSEDLKMYFRAMMWYGRLTYRLMDDFETQRALLLVQAMRSATASDGTPAMTLWENIYEPTVFIVGKADDLGIYEYGALSDQIFGATPDLTVFADATLFAEFKQASAALPPPQINSMWVWIWQDQETVTKGFRFMGQRFTLDEYVFGQLIWRRVGTEVQPRGLPKGLDFFAAMGSDEAYNILDDMGETQYANFDTQMTKVQTEIAALGADSWTQNLYWGWLYSFQPLIEPKDASYPSFMQTQAWTRKDLHTALSSWTELKHDTILYAKQVMAEMGGGGRDYPPHGYVEPNPEAYARLLALAQMTYDGLQSRGLLSELMQANLTNLISELQFLKDIAERELAGEAITDEEYWHILYWGGVLEQFTLAAADVEGEGNSPVLEDQKAALVADVATGTYDLMSLVVLEEAIGQPTEIFVVLPDSPWRIAVGAVFTYYEFTVPPDQRMTDETWQGLVEAGTNPPQPDWTQMFIAP